jgi:hypothetical protein
MRALLAAAAAVTLSIDAAPARADWASDTLRDASDGAEVRDVRLFALGGAGRYTHAIAGWRRGGEVWFPRVLLLRCGARRCDIDFAHVGGAADEMRWAVVDLRGAPGPIAARERLAGGAVTRPKIDRMRWPALVIETSRAERRTADTRFSGRVTGVHRARELFVVSLRRRQHPVVFRRDSYRRGVGGAGHVSTFRLLRRRGGAPVIEESRARLQPDGSLCRPPPPEIIEHRLEGDRFVEARADLSRRGC